MTHSKIQWEADLGQSITVYEGRKISQFNEEFSTNGGIKENL